MKEKKRGKGRLVWIILIAVVVLLGAAAALMYVKGWGPFHKEEQVIAGDPAAYFVYADTNILIDGRRMILGGTAEEPADIPKISGLEYNSIVVGQTLTARENAHLDYAMTIIGDLNKRGIEGIHEVYVSAEGDATLYADTIKILLGLDSDTEKKIEDLANFYGEVAGRKGTLYMTEVAQENIGYTFKVEE